MTVYTPDQWQEAIVALANAGAGGTPADTYQTGNLTAAQPTVGTPVAGGTVTIALGEGQATVDAALTGTWNAGTTIIFDGTEDSGVTSNWFPMFGQDTGVANPPNISSIAGGASKLVRIPSMGYAQVRVRANPFAGGDNVAVRLAASVAGSGMAGSLSTNDGTFATQTTAAAAKTDLDTILTNTNRVGASVALTSPPVNTNAGTDTVLTFASKVNHFLIQNNTSANCYIMLDTASSTAGVVLVPGAIWRDDIPVTSPHVFTAAAQPLNAASGIIVEGWL